MRITRYLISALLILVILAGCGGRRSSPAGEIDTGLFTPNYIQALDTGLFHWNHVPVRIKFDLPTNWSDLYPSDTTLHVEGANEWNQPGLQALTMVVKSGQDVTVSFVPQSHFGGKAQGVTTYTYNSGSREIIAAGIEVALDNPYVGTLSAADAQVIIAHEIGHAIGIGGHSPYSEDLLYYLHTFGSPRFPTPRDLNTIMTAYHAEFGRGIPSGQAFQPLTPGEIRTAVIE